MNDIKLSIFCSDFRINFIFSNILEFFNIVSCLNFKIIILHLIVEMKKWKLNSWKNYPVKHIPEYVDKGNLTMFLIKLKLFHL